MKETLRHQEALDYYYGLGSVRSYYTTAMKVGVTKSAIRNWAKAFNWQERVEQRDIELAKELQKKTNGTIIETKARYRKIIKAAIDRWMDRFKLKEIGPESVMDLERLVKLDLLLIGEPTERNALEHDVSKLTTDEVRARLAELLAGRRRQGAASSPGGAGAPDEAEDCPVGMDS